MSILNYINHNKSFFLQLTANKIILANNKTQYSAIELLALNVDKGCNCFTIEYEPRPTNGKMNSVNSIIKNGKT